MAIRKNLALIIACAFLALILAMGVQAKSNKDDDKDVPPPQDDFSVPAEVNALATAVSNHGRTIASMSNQVNEIVSQYQTLDGDVGKADKKNMDQDKILKDMQLRLQTVEDKISILTQQLQEVKTEGLLKPASSQRFEEFKSYSKAVEQVNSKNYTKAVNELTTFIDTHKKSPFVGYAQYWIGEAYYLQDDYEMAITEYQKLLSKDAKSPKAAGALYKQGLAFYHLQSFDDAKEFLSKVIKTFPQTIEAAQASSQIVHIDNILAMRKQEEIERQEIESQM